MKAYAGSGREPRLECQWGRNCDLWERGCAREEENGASDLRVDRAIIGVVLIRQRRLRSDVDVPGPRSR